MPNIVSNGGKRLIRQIEAEVRLEVQARYRPLFQNAGLWKTAWLVMKMKHEIRREMEKRVPKQGLFLASGFRAA